MKCLTNSCPGLLAWFLRVPCPRPSPLALLACPSVPWLLPLPLAPSARGPRPRSACAAAWLSVGARVRFLPFGRARTAPPGGASVARRSALKMASRVRAACASLRSFRLSLPGSAAPRLLAPWRLIAPPPPPRRGLPPFRKGAKSVRAKAFKQTLLPILTGYYRNILTVFGNRFIMAVGGNTDRRVPTTSHSTEETQCTNTALQIIPRCHTRLV